MTCSPVVFATRYLGVVSAAPLTKNWSADAAFLHSVCRGVRRSAEQLGLRVPVPRATAPRCRMSQRTTQGWERHETCDARCGSVCLLKERLAPQIVCCELTTQTLVDTVKRKHDNPLAAMYKSNEPVHYVVVRQKRWKTCSSNMCMCAYNCAEPQQNG